MTKNRYAVLMAVTSCLITGLPNTSWAQEQESEPVPASEPEQPAADLDTIPVDAAPESDDAGEQEKDPRFFIGIDRNEAILDLTDANLKLAYGSGHLDGGFYRARFGAHLAPAIFAEAQIGFAPDSDSGAKKVKTEPFYALYLVTSAPIFDTVEISARVGYAWIGAERDGFSEDFDNVSYGIGLDLPLRHLSKSLSRFRLNLAGTVYGQDRDARYYGWSYGLRYDF